MGARERVPAAEGAVRILGQQDRRAVLVRVARPPGPVVADVRPGGLDVRRRRADEEAADERERRQDRGRREVVRQRRRCQHGGYLREALVKTAKVRGRLKENPFGGFVQGDPDSCKSG